jgi:PAS domain S-box-containing protein
MDAHPTDPATTTAERAKTFIAYFLLGAAISALGVLAVHWQNQQHVELAVQDELGRTVAHITNRVAQYQYGLRGVRGVVLAVGDKKLNRETIQNYTDSRDYATEFPGANGFGFIRRVAREDEQDFLTRARQDGRPDFAIRELAPNPGERFVIQYIAPLAQNAAAVGLDIASEYERRTAALAAMDHGDVKITGPITLVQASGKKQQSILMLLPIYQTPRTPNDLQARRLTLVGWSYAPLILERVLEDIDIDPTKVWLTMQDVTDMATPVTVLRNRTDTPGDIRHTAFRDVDVYGRVWRIRFAALPAFTQTLYLMRLQSAVALGLGISLIFAMLMQARRTTRQRRQQLFAEQAKLAAIVDNAADAIIGTSLQGVVSSWNHGAEAMFGFSRHEAVGRTLSDLVVPPGLREEANQTWTRIAHGEHVQHIHSQRHSKDGKLLEVAITVAPIYDESRSLLGASNTIRDISAQIAAEGAIHTLNRNLEEKIAQRTQELDDARRFLRTVLDAVPSLIGYWDNQLINRLGNNAYHAWFGTEPGTLVGRSMRNLLGEDLYALNLPYIEGVLRGDPQSFEREIPTSDGKMRYSLSHYLPDCVDGKVQGFYVVVHDVTEIATSRELLANALRENSLLLKTINEQLMYSATDSQGRILDVNPHFCQVMGYTREELMGQNHRLLNSGEHSADFWQGMWKKLQSGEPWHGEICNRHKDGTLLWHDTVIAPLIDETGATESYIALRIDVSESRRTATKLRQVNLMLGNVLQAASEMAIIATDTDGLVTIFNTGAERMLGYGAADIVGKCTPARFHLAEEVEERGKLLSAQEHTPIEGFRVFTLLPERSGAERREWTYVGRDGTQLQVSLTVTAMRDDDGFIVGYLGVATDITQQLAQQRDLAATREQLQMAADTAKLGIWTWTLNDNALKWNRFMFDLYAQPDSLTESGLNYQHWYERVHPDDVEATAAALSDAVAGDGVYEPVFRVVHPDETVRYVQAGAQVVRDRKGNALSVTGFNLDITARMEYEVNLIQAKHDAEQASVAKSQFLANMSHEIRTPMNAVLGMLQLALKTELTERQRDYLVKAKTAGKSLLGLLNDILDYSKVDAGKLELDLHPFDLENLLRDLSVVLSGVLNGKDVELMFDVDTTLPSVLLGDRLRLLQILINLAGNAIKFTEHGQVMVSVRDMGREGGQVQLQVTITDTGIGISAAQLERIFSGFTQAEASTTRRFGGTGLGLAISRRLVELIGGSLQVQSTLGHGSRFWFDLRLDLVDSTPITVAPALPQHTLSVLVVDDNALVGEILVRTIESLNWQVDYVDSGAKAIEQVAQLRAQGRHYSVILMDWRMPGMDGISAAEAIRSQCGDDVVPVVIMVTAHGREALAQLADQDNPPFDAFLTKPVTPQQLVDTIGLALGAQGNRLPSGQIAPRQNRLAGLQILVVEDNAINRQVASELLMSEGADVFLASGGLEGVDQVVNGKNRLDLVIMDVQMPDIDGLEATRRIRADARLHALPILAMTANASHADRLACLAAGMNDHIGKPIDIDDVAPRILRLLERSLPLSARAEPLGSSPPPEVAIAPKVEFIEAPSSLLRRFGDRAQVLQNVFKHFPAECSRLLTLLQNQVQQLDVDGLGATLHAFKGVASTMGALALARRTSALETALKQSPAPDVAKLINAQCLTQLEQLINESVTLLDQVIRDLQPAPVATVPATLAPRSVPDAAHNWAAHLLRIQQMLRTKNLRILEERETLLAAAPAAHEPEVRILLDQIDAMQFEAALNIVDSLLAETKP